MTELANWALDTAVVRRHQIMPSFLFLAVLLVVPASVSAQKKSALAELADLQGQTGLSIVDVDRDGIGILSFRDRRLTRTRPLPEDIDIARGLVSPDGGHLAIAQRFPTGTYRTSTGVEFPTYGIHISILRSDGSDLRQYREIAATPICWTSDKRHLIVEWYREMGKPWLGFQLLHIDSGEVRPLPGTSAVYSLCASADGNEFVCASEGKLRIYNLTTHESRLLGPGRLPTWSPDGKWIAYSEGERYCFVSPDGSRRMPCFRKPDGRSPLWWSPDSKFVAFVTPTRWLFKWDFQEINGLRLRIRRLADGSESWILRYSGKGGPAASFQWAILPEAKRKP